MVNAIKTAAFVVLVSVFVWVWAEAESLRVEEAAPAVEFAAPATGDVRVRVVEGDFRGGVRVRLEGSTQGVEAARRALARGVRATAGSKGVPAAAGTHTVDLREVIGSVAEVADAGVTVIECEPRTATVVVERMVEREVRVRGVVTGVEIEGEATVTPATVRMRLTERAAADLDGVRGGAYAEAVVDAAEAGKLRDDAPQSVQGKVRLATELGADSGLTITPERVSVTARLKSRTGRVTLASVPVWVALPRTELAGWEVEVLDPFVKDVSVTGASEFIRRIETGEVAPVAIVALTTDELVKGVTSKRAVFVTLPAPVGVSCTAEETTVRLRVTKRGTDAGRDTGAGGAAGAGGIADSALGTAESDLAGVEDDGGQ